MSAERVSTRVLKRVFGVVAVLAAVLYFAVAGIYLALRYAVLPQIDAFRPQIEQKVSDKLHAQLRIGRLTARWSGLQPSVDIDNLRIDTADGAPGLAIPHASATLSWRSLARLAPVLSDLSVDGPDVIIARSADGALSVAGVPIPTQRTGNNAFMTWLLTQQSITLRDGTLRWRDAERQAPELVLKRIRFSVLSDGLRHRMALAAPADGEVLHGPLDFRADFRHKPFETVGRPQNWSGRAYISTGPVDLPTLSHYLKMPFQAFSGRFDNRIWANFAGGDLQSASGDLTSAEVALRVRPTQPRLDMPIADFGWTLERNDGDYTLRLANLHAELGQAPLPDGTPVTRLLASSTLAARFRPAAVGRGQLFSLEGDRVDLGLVAEFARALPLPQRALNQIVRYNPRGLIANYSILAERAPPQTEQAASDQRMKGDAPFVRYALKGELEGISVQAQEPGPGLTPTYHPRAGIPGVENLWGSIDADEKHGNIVIDTQNAAITLPGVFDNPRLTFDEIAGRASWTVANAPGEPRPAITAHIDTLRVKNEHAAASVTADYSNPGHGRGSLDLKANVDYLRVTSLPLYLPTSLSEKIRLYLGHALQGGISRHGTIEIHGDLTRFPYSRFPDAGKFHIVAPFTGGRFEPSPYPPRKMLNGTPNVWPAFDGIDGKFELEQNKLSFDVDRGHYRGVSVSKVTGRIDDLGNRASKLMIDGRARGPLTDMLDYVENSSLGPLSQHIGTKIQATGNAALALELAIPRAPPPIPGAPVAKPVRLKVGYKGSLTFEGNDLAYADFPPLTRLRGRAAFAEKTVSLEALTGRFLGGDIRASGGVAPDGRYAFNLNGRIGADAAQSLNVRINPQTQQFLRHLSGTAPYELHVRGIKKALPRIEARSDLTGLALDFPAPFKKAQGTPMPFAFTFEPAGNSAAGQHDAQLTLGALNAHYLLAGSGKAISVVRGAIGVNKPADLPAEGVTATVDIDALDADAWQKLAAEINPPPPANAPPRPPLAQNVKQFLPTQVALHFTTLKLLNRHWENVVIGASEQDRKWQANIASNQVSGYVSWTPGATRDSPGALSARFARVVIPGKEENDLVGRVIQRPSRNMPSIDLIVNELVVRERSLGRLQVEARNAEEGGEPVWFLDRLELINPDAQLTAHANWRSPPGPENADADSDDTAPRRTAVDFKLDVKDAGLLLDRLGLPRTMEAGKGTMSGKAVWDGGPTGPDLPTLNGDLAVDLHHGRILKVNPGAAKLLGVLSLQSLAHFLTLNFDDVVGHGLPFDRITGSAKIVNGVVQTNDFAMVTSPARVELTGAVNLPDKTQDLHARVVPTISAGAVAIGAAVINPLLGLGTLAADLLLSKSIGKAFARDYSITGTWTKPVVQRVNRDQGKIESPSAATVN